MYTPYYINKNERMVRLPSLTRPTFEEAVRAFTAHPQLMAMVPGPGIIADDDTPQPGYLRPAGDPEDLDSWFWSADK
jgi:hypothetical protein